MNAGRILFGHTAYFMVQKTILLFEHTMSSFNHPSNFSHKSWLVGFFCWQFLSFSFLSRYQNFEIFFIQIFNYVTETSIKNKDIIRHQKHASTIWILNDGFHDTRIILVCRIRPKHVHYVSISRTNSEGFTKRNFLLSRERFSLIPIICILKNFFAISVEWFWIRLSLLK